MSDAPPWIVDGRSMSPPTWWHAGTRGTRRRRKPPRAVVLHHTGGERDAVGVCSTLRDRGLSIHYVIDASGKVTQHADPDLAVTFHAGGANEWSIGVEITNRGVAPASKARARVAYQSTMHGRPTTFLRFSPDQVDAAQRLCEYLCERFGLPLRVPCDSALVATRAVLDLPALSAWRGVLGHYHIERGKVDPSPHLLDELATRWGM